VCKLSLYLFRVFSVDVAHPSFEAAKAACAADAIVEGILDFIEFGNGQTVPAERRLFQPQEDDTVSSAPPIALTLQGFFEALPRPLPEPVDDKTVGEINAPGWLNALIQSARGGKFEHKFIWTTDTELGSMFFVPFLLCHLRWSVTHVFIVRPWISTWRRSAPRTPCRGLDVHGRAAIPEARGCEECGVPCSTCRGSWGVHTLHHHCPRDQDIRRDKDTRLREHTTSADNGVSKILAK